MCWPAGSSSCLRGLGAVACAAWALGCLTWLPPSRALAAEPPAARLTAQPPASIVTPRPEPRAASPWPELAAVFPGILVHGSGLWLQRRSTSAERALQLEGAALGTTFMSGLLLFQTGASRYFVGPLALTSVAGVGGLGLSFVANVYATWAPREGFGEPARSPPLIETRLGYLHVYDPQFEYRHVVTSGIDARWRGWHGAFAGAHAPDQQNQRLDVALGRRLFGPGVDAAPIDEQRDGSYLDLRASGANHRFDADGFQSFVLGFEVLGRADIWHVFPDVRGAFFQLGAGLAKQWFAFELPAVDATTDTSLLLAHMGFGLYLGNRGEDASATGGEVEAYYDHRHDGFANGLKLRGLGSGPAGHLGLRGSYLLSPHWGLYAVSELGSAWTLGLGVVIRAGVH